MTCIEEGMISIPARCSCKTRRTHLFIHPEFNALSLLDCGQYSRAQLRVLQRLWIRCYQQTQHTACNAGCSRPTLTPLPPICGCHAALHQHLHAPCAHIDSCCFLLQQQSSQCQLLGALRGGSQVQLDIVSLAICCPANSMPITTMQVHGKCCRHQALLDRTVVPSAGCTVSCTHTIPMFSKLVLITVSTPHLPVPMALGECMRKTSAHKRSGTEAIFKGR